MYQDDYLFFPEAQTVDKLLSLLNIQSQETLEPDKMISILGLLNLLNIMGVANDSGSAGPPLTPETDINSGQLNQLLNSIPNNQESSSQPDLNNLLANNSGLQNILNLLGGGSQTQGETNRLDPSLLLKLLNLFNQIRDTKTDKGEATDEAEANQPVKSEPYEEEEVED